MNRFRCDCVWGGEQCPNAATQEDGLCDWCGTRRPEDMRNNPKAIYDLQTGEFLALGGGGEPPEAHQRFDGVAPTACWLDDNKLRASARRTVLEGSRSERHEGAP